MSSILRQKSSLYCYKGISVFVLDGNHVAKVINRKVPALYFRTGNGVPGPWETPPLRQSSSTIEVPSLQQDIDKEAVGPTTREDARNAALEKNLIRSLKAMTTVYDFVTLPFYAAVQQPWKKLALHNSQKAALVDPEKMIYKTLLPKAPLHEEIDRMGTDTVAKLFAHALKKHGNKRSLGVREIIGEEEVLDRVTGKMVKKLELGAYRWKTYPEVGATVDNMVRGLDMLKLKPKEKIAIFAETREEWFITAMAAFRRNLPIVTVFTTLGDDGVAHALNETEVTTLITSEDLMPRCKEILKQIPRVKNVVYMDRGSNAKRETLANNASVFKYSELLAYGAKNETPEQYDEPKPSDVAIIMYTSGSTGVPKGVMLSHGNMIAALKSSVDVFQAVGQPCAEDAHPAYLPMAHVLELMCEAMTFIQGVRIGYSSPLTLIDNAPGLKEGTKGDASVLRPTVMPAVPLVVERISKGIQQKIAEATPIRRILFDFFYKYKVGWAKLGYDTPLVNKIFFSKITKLVGGRMRYMIVGGAPLAAQTQEFVRTVLCCPVAVGYGMTESSAVAALSLNYDLTLGRSGIPISSGCLRLVNWEEGGYRVTDQPYPRGEVYIGGDNVALGYFKREHSTDFFEEDGVRWVKTGDIAEVHPDGVFRIIDRKKDLVKLANGKFVSLGRVEAALKTCPAVDNICVHANPSCSYTVAIMVPTKTMVEKIANELGKPIVSFESLCADPVIEDRILADIQAQGKITNLQNFEIPKKIHLYPEQWMPQSGLVTAAFKIKRNNVYKQFQNQLNEMYSR